MRRLVVPVLLVLLLVPLGAAESLEHLQYEESEGALQAFTVDGIQILESIRLLSEVPQAGDASKVPAQTSQDRHWQPAGWNVPVAILHDQASGILASSRQPFMLGFELNPGQEWEIEGRIASAQVQDGLVQVIGSLQKESPHQVVVEGPFAVRWDPEAAYAVAGDIGAQIVIGDVLSPPTLYDDIDVDVHGVLDEGLRIELDASLPEGRTIVIDLVDDIALDQELDIRFYDVIDAETQTQILLHQADDLRDVLDANNDGGQPEYWIVRDQDGVHVLVSVPHWSLHAIELQSLGPIAVNPSVLMGILGGLAVGGLLLFMLVSPSKGPSSKR